MRQKIRRLRLEVVVHGEKSGGTTTSDLVLPEELISAEDALKALSQPGLPRQDIQRLGLEVEVDKKRKKQVVYQLLILSCLRICRVLRSNLSGLN